MTDLDKEISKQRAEIIAETIDRTLKLYGFSLATRSFESGRQLILIDNETDLRYKVESDGEIDNPPTGGTSMQRRE